MYIDSTHSIDIHNGNRNLAENEQNKVPYRQDYSFVSDPARLNIFYDVFTRSF